MFDKIKQYQNQINWHDLRDTRVTGLLIFGVIILLISWSGVKVIETNYQLEKQISVLQQENNVQRLTNENLKLQKDYYNTDQYLELAARQNFGLAAPGEKELIVPKQVALARAPALKAASSPVAAPEAKTLPTYQRNAQAWVNFFLHRTDN